MARPSIHRIFKHFYIKKGIIMKKIEQWLNATLATLSMYNGMLFGLASVWGVAVIFSLVGILHFHPLAMVASLAVLVVSVGMASWLCGALFGVRAFGVSSMISGVILALIFTPTLQPGGLLVLALVGLIAGASKYVLAYRGRHIFNPVAIAAVIIGFTGLGAASWWVATPSLTIFVLATVMVSLYKSKRFGVFLTFLGVAVAILLGVFAYNSASSLASAPWLLLSWPLIFFAGVMLIEPLTLPPKKWHMYVEAIVVAVLFALPLQAGLLHTSPELALVIGNIFAAIVAGRRAILLTFKERKPLTPTTDELIFTTTKPVYFEPGQYMEITVPHEKADLRGERRSFSMTSIPGKTQVSFGVKFYQPSSSFKKTLRGLQKGAPVAVANLAGDFILPKDATKPLVMVAGGIGITPFISQLQALQVQPSKKDTNTQQGSKQPDVALVYALSDATELAYMQLLGMSAAAVTIVSPTKPPGLPKHWKYIKARRLDAAILAKAVPDITRRYAYVSGPTLFVQSVKRILRRSGARKLHTDYFAGY